MLQINLNKIVIGEAIRRRSRTVKLKMKDEDGFRFKMADDVDAVESPISEFLVGDTMREKSVSDVGDIGENNKWWSGRTFDFDSC